MERKIKVLKKEKLLVAGYLPAILPFPIFSLLFQTFPPCQRKGKGGGQNEKRDKDGGGGKGGAESKWRTNDFCPTPPPPSFQAAALLAHTYVTLLLLLFPVFSSAAAAAQVNQFIWQRFNEGGVKEMGKREGAAWRREGDVGKSPQSSKRGGAEKIAS